MDLFSACSPLLGQAAATLGDPGLQATYDEDVIAAEADPTPPAPAAPSHPGSFHPTASRPGNHRHAGTERLFDDEVMMCRCYRIRQCDHTKLKA